MYQDSYMDQPAFAHVLRTLEAKRLAEGAVQGAADTAPPHPPTGSSNTEGGVAGDETRDPVAVARAFAAGRLVAGTTAAPAPAPVPD